MSKGNEVVIIEAIESALDFLEGQEDAEYFTDRADPVPNEAMRVCNQLRAALSLAQGKTEGKEG